MRRKISFTLFVNVIFTTFMRAGFTNVSGFPRAHR
jgi:hypothetical protein